MRGKRAKRRKQIGDVRYHDTMVSRLINKVMQDGKKSLAENLVYSALEEGASKVGEKEVLAFLIRLLIMLDLHLKLKQEELVVLTTRFLFLLLQEGKRL